MEKEIKQPEIQYQEILDDLMSRTPDVVTFLGRKCKIGWLHRHTQRKFTHIVLKEKDPEKRNVKLCACVLTNNVFAWFKPLVYALRWRWYWYVVDLDDIEILRVIDASKKKIQYDPSLMLTILSTEMKDTMMAMIQKEARATQAVQVGVRHSV
ncbi:MAG: hypothetical protein MSS96_02800 [Bacteroidales bacterium]|nr:hypothetical protein [Bacteroidales bacterium]